MSLEDQHTDCKSLRTVSGKTADWAALAQDAVCFANGAGGRLLIGIEDGQALPPADHAVAPELLDRLRKRVGELTVNVQALPSLQRAANGGEFIELVIDRSSAVASTRDGRHFLRVGDTCQPVLGDDVLRLANERPGRPLEAMDSGVSRTAADADRLAHFAKGIRSFPIRPTPLTTSRHWRRWRTGTSGSKALLTGTHSNDLFAGWHYDAVVGASGLAFAQSPQGGPSPDGYMIQGGKVMVNKGGKASPMDSDTTSPDGTKIMKDGTVIRKDGTKSMTKNGDRMDMSGAMRK